MRVLITGAAGQLGFDVARHCVASGDDVFAFDRATLDVADREQVLQVVGSIGPDVIVHCATFTNVDGCELDRGKAYLVNALGCRHVAEAARHVGARVVGISTDFVFDGRGGGVQGGEPYTEWDPTGPLNQYGRSKLGGEMELFGLLGADATVVRTSWLSGQAGSNFVKTMLRVAGAGDGPITVVADQHGCPTFTADLAVTVRRLAVSRLPGLFHVTNAEPTTWHGFAQAIFAGAGFDPGRVQAITTDQLQPSRPAVRPAYSVLDNLALRGVGLEAMPPWRPSLAVLLEALR